MSAVQGMQTQMGIDTNATVTARFDYMHENVGLREILKDCNGLRGTLSHDVSRVRVGNRPCGGSIFLQPNAAELALLLPWIFGGAPSGSGTVTYPLADAAPTGRYVVVDRITKVFSYNGCQVDRAIFRATQGEPLSLQLDIVGIDESVGNSGTFPSLAIDVTNGPFLLTDLSYSLASTTYNSPDFELVVDHHLDKDRFYNSQTITSINRTDRTVSLRSHFPYGDASALYGASGSSGIAVVGTFTNGNAVLVFSIVKLCYPRETPPVEGRREVMLPLDGMAFKSAGTLELVTTLHAA